MIRNYTDNDSLACMDIVNKVWNFDEKYKPIRVSNLFKKIYTLSSLSESNFSVVIEEDYQVKGFLFGKCGGENPYITEYSGVFGNMRLLFQLLFLKGMSLKRKKFFVHILSEHEKNRLIAEPNRENEVNLFAVLPNTQGKGYGKILMNAFVDNAKMKNVKSITLDTDAECNYKFYDHYGFKLKAKFFSPMQKEYSGNSGECYVYQLNL